MALDSMKLLLEKAKQGKYAVGAFNVVNLLEIQAVYQAALDAGSPVIVEVSESGCKEFGNGDLRKGARIAAAIVHEMSNDELYKNIPSALHLDHGKSLESVIACVESGFTSVMIDASSRSFEGNEELTKKVVDYAREYGSKHDRYISVEAELGTVGGKKDTNVTYTDPNEVVPFVQYTGIDALAIAWGTLHGVNKKAGNAELRPELIKECYEKLKTAGLNSCYIVSHGSSTVPQELVDKIKKYGGELESSGIAPAEAQKVVSYGVTKVNIATDLALAMTGAIREHFTNNPADWDPRKYAQSVREAVYQTVMQNMKLLGSSGKI